MFSGAPKKGLADIAITVAYRQPHNQNTQQVAQILQQGQQQQVQNAQQQEVQNEQQYIQKAQQVAEQLTQDLENHLERHVGFEAIKKGEEKMFEATKNLLEHINSGELAKQAKDIGPRLTELLKNDSPETEKVAEEMVRQFESDCKKALH